MSKPVIAITASPDDSWLHEYSGAIDRNGGDPWMLLTGHQEPVDEVLRRADGLLVSGGEDVDPSSYGQAVDPAANVKSSRDRDAMELPILRAAIERDMPVLCLCRGMQALNVTMGGTLIQHIDGHTASVDGDGEEALYHRIFITPGSKLAAVVGSGGIVRVNSWHHQGVGEAQKSPRLLASAYSLEDGIIEALESPHHDWVIGVQFHPEIRKEVPPHFERLFQGFVQRAGKRSGAATA